MSDGAAVVEPLEWADSTQEAIVLVGEPASVRGRIHLNNQGSERIVLREARVQLAAQGGRVTGSQISRVRVPLSATLHPGQVQSLELTVSLGDMTPPGQYNATLTVGGLVRPAVLHVVERVRFSILPQVVPIIEPAGASVVKRVIFSNQGNVSITIGDIGEVALRGDPLLAFDSVARVVDARKKPRPLEEILGEAIRYGATIMVGQGRVLTIKNPNPPTLVPPGEMRAVDFEIRLPDQLGANSRFVARVPIYGSNLDFMIVPVATERKTASTATT